MADTFVKNPKLIVGTQSQVESEMGANDIGFATDVEFYTKAEVDDRLLDMSEYIDEEDRKINADIRQIDTNTRTIADWINKKDEDGNRAVLETEAQDAYRAINELNAKIGAGGASLPILTMMMSDHVINDMSWLRADTFSWQSGDVYKAAYEHLLKDYDSSDFQRVVWGQNESGYIDVYTTTGTPEIGTIVYDTDIGEEVGTVSAIGDNYIDVDNYGDTYRFYRARDLDVMSHSDTIGDITIKYALAQDGHKICLPDQESNLIALYEATGVAWYFILDTVNKQFKLPREDKDGKYLYFYVGNFTQEAIEQTAGLNAELFNGKADVATVNGIDSRVDLLEGYDYVVESQLPTSSNGYTWYRKYKSGWVEQGGRSKRTAQDVSVAFPVPFMDTNYNAQAIRIAGNVSSTGQEPVQIKEMSTTGLKISQYNSIDSSQSIQWQVSGYAAS